MIVGENDNGFSGLGVYLNGPNCTHESQLHSDHVSNLSGVSCYTNLRIPNELNYLLGLLQIMTMVALHP